MSEGPTYKDYVIKEKLEDFKKMCKKNCLDFYSCGCILTAHLVLEELMQHTYPCVWRGQKTTPKDAWESAMRQTNYHSGASAAITATIVARYSPRGNEFREWCKKEKSVMVKWD